MFMASTNERLDAALKALRARGHDISTAPALFGSASISNDGSLIVTVDGQPRTVEQIYGMAARESDNKDTPAK